MPATDNPVLDLTLQLMRRASVTPDDGGCQDIVGERLQALGFTVQALGFGDVRNLWATHGTGHPIVVFAGHTDVVPPGPDAQWESPPFTPTLRNDHLYGRGAADMKSSLAAMLVATERFIAANTTASHPGTVAYLLTSDEEGPAIDGTRRVIEHLTELGVDLDYCVVGEPSSSQRLGDTVRVGRRGSLNAKLTICGTQGHVAYPELARNPIHDFAPALEELTNIRWDQGNESFPPTSLQISNMHAGTGANNVIPGELELEFNFRFSTEQTAEGLQRQVAQLLDRHGQDYRLEWTLSGNPFLTQPGPLRSATTAAIKEVTGQLPEESTSGGTSDGRFIAPTGCEVVEIGPINATIHKINECVRVDDLMPLAAIYQAILRRLLGPSDG
jgi:succinyl-diaminopimelate desuccinylase